MKIVDAIAKRAEQLISAFDKEHADEALRAAFKEGVIKGYVLGQQDLADAMEER